MVKLVQIHQIRNLPKIKNMFMSQVHGNLILRSFDDAIENVMMQNGYKWSQLHVETRITRFGALHTKFPISRTLIPKFEQKHDFDWFNQLIQQKCN